MNTWTRIFEQFPKELWYWDVRSLKIRGGRNCCQNFAYILRQYLPSPYSQTTNLGIQKAYVSYIYRLSSPHFDSTKSITGHFLSLFKNFSTTISHTHDSFKYRNTSTPQIFKVSNVRSHRTVTNWKYQVRQEHTGEPNSLRYTSKTWTGFRAYSHKGIICHNH